MIHAIDLDDAVLDGPEQSEAPPVLNHFSGSKVGGATLKVARPANKLMLGIAVLDTDVNRALRWPPNQGQIAVIAVHKIALPRYRHLLGNVARADLVSVEAKRLYISKFVANVEAGFDTGEERGSHAGVQCGTIETLGRYLFFGSLRHQASNCRYYRKECR